MLECAEALEVAVGGEHLFDSGFADTPDQLVLEILDAGEEADTLHLRAREPRPEACVFEGPANDGLFTRVIEAGHLDAGGQWLGLTEKRPDRVRASELDDPNPFGGEAHAAARGQRLERGLVAHPFDNHDALHDERG